MKFTSAPQSLHAPSGPLHSTPLWRVSKYLWPEGYLRSLGEASPAPTCQRSIAEIANLHPQRAPLSSVGAAESLARYDYLCHTSTGREVQSLPRHSRPAAWISRIDGGVSYGRHCIAIGPGGEAVRETGFNLDLTERAQARPLKKLTPRYHRYRWEGDLTSRRRLPQRERIAGSVATLNTVCSHNFYHWMIDILPRLATLRRAGVEADYYLVDCYTPFQRRVLAALDVPVDRLIQPHCGLAIEAEELLVPSSPSPECLRTFGAMLRDGLGVAWEPPAVRPSRRLYISRRQTATRRLRNEVELEAFLARRGFETHCFEDYDLAQQCKLISEAETIVATHGAALANLVFARPRTQVIEIMPEGRYNPDCYPRLSRTFNLEHQLLYARRSRHKQILHVSLDAAAAALGMLSERRAAA